MSEVTSRRPYDSPMRREQAAATRERIVKAGGEILHGFPIWNWDAVTARAVAERSGVSERTVYRYFASERDLRDAVMARLSADAHVDLENLEFEGIRDIAARIIDYTASFPCEGSPQDPTLESARQRQREALIGALLPMTKDWLPSAREVAAAMLNVLWSYTSYKLLVGDWNLRPSEAAAGVNWIVRLIEEAIRDGDRPTI